MFSSRHCYAHSSLHPYLHLVHILIATQLLGFAGKPRRSTSYVCTQTTPNDSSSRTPVVRTDLFPHAFRAKPTSPARNFFVATIHALGNICIRKCRSYAPRMTASFCSNVIPLYPPIAHKMKPRPPCTLVCHLQAYTGRSCYLRPPLWDPQTNST